MSLFEQLGDRVAEADEPRRPPSPPIPAAGPFRREFWRSPLRGRWLTSFLGSTLLPFVIVAALTGFLSHAAYDPGLGSNDVSGGFEVDLYFFDWPVAPAWLYSLTQSLHVLAGFAAIPILLAKLWSVIPKLFERPATRSVAHGLERLSLLTLVGSALFLFVSGVINVQYWLPFGFSFVPAHYYAALIFVAALAVHLVLKLPVVARTFRREGAFRPLGEGIERMRVADAREDDLASLAPAAPTISRRGMLGAVALGSAGLLTMTAGSNLLGSVRGIALLSPRGQDYGDGPNDFQVNKTAAYAGIDPARTGGSWRLRLAGAGRDVSLSRAELLAMPQHAERLPIACVEGWTTWQDWEGVRLADLAALAGVDAASGGTVLVESLQEAGAFAQASLASNQLFDPRSLLALRVNGADLSLDHGYPGARHRPGAPRCPQHEMGQTDDLHAGMRARFRYEYGAEPLHLIAVAASLLLCGYALLRITEVPGGGRILIWLVTAALLHDLVALPLYSALFRLTHGAASRAIPDRTSMLTALNHVRVPTALSLLFLVVYAPLILRLDPERYEGTTGLGVDGYLGRWLLISAGMFLISGITYAVRLRRGAARVRGAQPADRAERRLRGPGRAGGVLVLALSIVVTAWVIAAVVIGLVTNGL